ncbi:MAG TPA: G1 family glutamic endopeptidase [Solirubrobacteraceae bacterium]|jgi:hypothetical protein
MSTKHLIPTLVATGSVAFAIAAPAVASADTTTTEAQASASGNWSGYAVGSSDSSKQYTNVSGSWTEPSANCNAGQGVASFWVGLGGAGQDSQALEQTGTEVDCTGASPKHTAWYEVVPSAPVNFNLSVSAGDHMSARVTADGNDVTMSLKDDTTGQSASKTVHADSVDLSSAEWIAEAPSQCDQGGNCTPLPLADFGKVNFTNASATAGGHTGTISDSSWQAQPIELSPGASMDGGFVSDTTTSSAGAQPADLSSDGSSFSVSWSSDATGVSTSGSGAGSAGGSGSGYPGGYGDGSGYGGGAGYGDGSGYGGGYGDGSGYGSGYGGSGYGPGAGYGDGSGDSGYGPGVVIVYGAGYGS